MAITLYKARGRFVGYRVVRKAHNKMHQLYFTLSTYGTKAQAHKAAKQADKLLAKAYPYKKLVRDNGRLFGLSLYERWHDDTGFLEQGMRLTITQDYDLKFNKTWTFGAHDWESAYAEAVEHIMHYRKLKPCAKLTKLFAEAKAFYNPGRKANFRQRRRRT